MTDQEAFDTAVRWVTQAHEGRGTPVDKLFQEVALVRERLLKMFRGEVEPPVDAYGMTPAQVIEAAEALGPLPDPPVHPGGKIGLSSDERTALTVTPSKIVCLECGKQTGLLKAHVQHHHRMTPPVYAARWGLDASYPFAPADYLERKRAAAKSQGLGRDVGHGTRARNRSAVEIARDEARRRVSTVDPDAMDLEGETIGEEEMARLGRGLVRDVGSD